MPTNNMDHLNFIEAVAAEDVAHLKIKEKTYGGSWKKRGGVGAFMMLARKWDRLENLLNRSEVGSALVESRDRYDIFDWIEESPKGEDGSALAEIRDLRRYLLLVEAEMVARGVVAVPKGSEEPKTVPVHAVGDAEPVPIEDSNRHADRSPEKVLGPAGRVLRDGINHKEWENLSFYERDYYSWDEKRQEYRLK